MIDSLYYDDQIKNELRERLGLQKDKDITWFIAGTLPNWQGTPLTIVVLLERSDPAQAEAIGLSILRTAVDGH